MISQGLLGPLPWDSGTQAALVSARSLSGLTLAQGVQAEIRGDAGTQKGDSRVLPICQPADSSQAEGRERGREGKMENGKEGGRGKEG